MCICNFNGLPYMTSYVGNFKIEKFRKNPGNFRFLTYKNCNLLYMIKKTHNWKIN